MVNVPQVLRGGSMRRFMYSILFALLCVFTGVLSQPALAAPHEMNAHSTLTTRSSFQTMGRVYRSYSIVRIELHTYVKMRVGPHRSGKTSSNNSDSFFFDFASSNGAGNHSAPFEEAKSKKKESELLEEVLPDLCGPTRILTYVCSSMRTML